MGAPQRGQGEESWGLSSGGGRGEGAMWQDRSGWAGGQPRPCRHRADVGPGGRGPLGWPGESGARELVCELPVKLCVGYPSPE